ncbi:MAG: tetratricopeptide repeat protein [Azoarcus sp.]|jgi:tetratricopeptide (TPR) repeat protein|nr:tetratricopeptide repeat protein [Azoarcus sp.]
MKHALARYFIHFGMILAFVLPGVPAFAADAGEDAAAVGIPAGENAEAGEDGGDDDDGDDGDDDEETGEAAAGDGLIDGGSDASLAAGDLPSQELTPEVLHDFLLAEIAGARGQLDLAARTYLDLVRRTRDPRIARRATQIAFAARDARLITEASRLWNEIAPQSGEARQLMENITRGHSDILDNVRNMLARVLAQDPDKLPGNLLELNRALARAEDREASRTIIYTLTEPYLAHPEAHFARAQASAISKRLTEAAGAIDRALELRPDWQPALLMKAQILIETDAETEASQLLESALGRNPGNRNLRLAYARSLVASRQFEAARAEFNTLLEAAPGDRDLLYAVALLSIELGDPATAESLLMKAIEAGHPQADMIRIQLGKIADERGAHAAARKWYNAVGPGGHTAEARIRSAQSLAKEGRLDPARRLLAAAAADNPDPENRRRFLLAEAQLLADAGRVREAYGLVDRVLREQPDDSDLLYESAMLAERIGMHEVLEGRLRKLIALHPDHAHAYNALGYSLADRGIRLEEAERLIARALELAPENAFILDSMGWVLFRRGDLAGALKQLEEAYALRTDPEIAAHLGEVLWRLERNDDARRILDEALAAHPGNTLLQQTTRRLYKPGTKP